ncbi:MAG: hypothetical protein L7F77_09420 [Candidatus Magnetominusculus sp. LBB02]|nr:hypothetical protein [Candidatus Magnetominusculus sp. LBB02]
MSEQFWIQADDGKFGGSLPGVPKHGGGHGAAKNKKRHSPFLAKLKKNMQMRKSRAALVSDDKPTAVGNDAKGEDGKKAGSMPDDSKKGNGSDIAEKKKQASSFVDKLKKRMEEKRKKSLSLLVKKAYDIGRAEQDKMHVAYDKLDKAGLSYEGVDKYYHSVAHCKIARLGHAGVISSHTLGVGKEFLDILGENFKNPTAWSLAQKGLDSAQDMEANEIGRQAGLNGDPSKSCEKLCKGQWPKGIPEEYKI